jgi:hypothetical protein
VNAARYWSRVDRSGDCWLWTHTTNRNGYGVTAHKVEGSWRQVLAHRASYELAYGPVPTGLELDHLCRTTRCVRPDHLEAVTHAENVRRGVKASATHCKSGHEFDPTWPLMNGRRRCRVCLRAYERERSRMRRAAHAAGRAAA